MASFKPCFVFSLLILILWSSCSQKNKSDEISQENPSLQAEIKEYNNPKAVVAPKQIYSIYRRFLTNYFRVGNKIRIEPVYVHPVQIICDTKEDDPTKNLTYYFLKETEPSDKENPDFFPYHDAALTAYSGGMKPFRKGRHFKEVNPEFIDWCAENLIPAPEAEIVKGFTARYIYHEGFSHIFRMYAKGYWLLKKRGYQEQIQTYVNEIDQADSNQSYEVNRMITAKYADDFPKLFSEQELQAPPYQLTARQVVSFWLRRGYDQSDVALWNALVKILSTYDKEWYEEYDRMMNS
jgi:hypothetical protein